MFASAVWKRRIAKNNGKMIATERTENTLCPLVLCGRIERTEAEKMRDLPTEQIIGAAETNEKRLDYAFEHLLMYAPAGNSQISGTPIQ